MDSYLEKVDQKNKSKLEGEEPSCRIQSLPRELILDILSRLPISSLIQLKFVCRAWRMLAQHPDLVSIHSTRMAKNNPCLILHCDYPIRNQLYFVDLPADYNKEEKVKRFHVPFRAAMPEFNVVGSCNGLLCISDSSYHDSLYIYNPFTRICQELPKSMRFSNPEEVVYGFGFEPTTKEYKVVKIVSYPINAYRIYGRPLRVTDMISEVQFFSQGCSDWRSMGKLNYHLDQWPSQVLVNRRLHWVALTRRLHPRRTIVSFGLADEQFKEIPIVTLFKGCNYHLVALGGCLSAAVYCNNGELLEIWVMTEYDVKESWVKKFDIKAHVPKGVGGDVNNKLFKISTILRKRTFVRVVCLLKDGDILLEYKNRALVSYDPVSEEFKDLMFEGMPRWFQTIVHVGSLTWTDTFIDT